MSRPSRNTDRLLLEAAKKLIPKTGFSRLNIRAVAKEAGVNLGMFNYHFKTKNRFIEVLLAEVYEDFLHGMPKEPSTGKNCREQLEKTMITIACYLRDHGDIVFPLFEEIILGNRHIMAFARKHMTRHIGILVGLVNRCQREGYIKKMSLLNVLPALMGVVLAPFLVTGVLGKFSQAKLLPGMVPKAIKDRVMTDEAVRQRVRIALKGLAEGA